MVIRGGFCTCRFRLVLGGGFFILVFTYYSFDSFLDILITWFIAIRTRGKTFAFGLFGIVYPERGTAGMVNRTREIMIDF